MVSRRRFMGGGAVLAGLGVAGCAAGGARSDAEPAAPTPSKEPATVEFYTIVNSTQKPIERRVMIEPFEQAYPHLKLSICCHDHGVFAVRGQDDLIGCGCHTSFTSSLRLPLRMRSREGCCLRLAEATRTVGVKRATGERRGFIATLRA